MKKMLYILHFVLILTFTGCQGEDLPFANWFCNELSTLTAIPGDMEVKLTWVPDEKANAEGYYITYSPIGDTIFVKSDTLDYTIKGLTNKTKYTFYVQADYGSNGRSAQKTVTCTPVTSRFPVTKLITAVGYKAVKATWTKPTANNVIGYVINLNPGDITINIDDPNISSKVINDLTNNVEYTVNVRAKYAIGNSDPATSKVTPGNISPISLSKVHAIVNDPVSFLFNDLYFSKAISSVSWNFGDGETSTIANPTHTYTKEGKYTVTMTAKYADGTSETGSIKKDIESRSMIICEQYKDRVIIVDSVTQKITWEWWPANADLPIQHISWFKHIDEAKPIYGKKYVLITASAGGGVAIVRISDKKTMFYACPGANTHSGEILPDGNLVVACSTGSTLNNNSLLIYKVDTLNIPATSYKSKTDAFCAHNAVWDKANQILMATADTQINFYKYNFDSNNPQLELQNVITLPDSGAHDLFPIYGENALWLTSTNVYKYNIGTKALTLAHFSLPNIKCVSSGPAGYGILLTQPKISYYTDEIINSAGGRAFYGLNYKMYKARWFIDNPFSYEEGADFKQP